MQRALDRNPYVLTPFLRSFLRISTKKERARNDLFVLRLLRSVLLFRTCRHFRRFPSSTLEEILETRARNVMKMQRAFASKKHAIGTDGASKHLKNRNRGKVPLSALRWRPPTRLEEDPKQHDALVKDLASDMSKHGQKEPLDVWRAEDGTLRVMAKNAKRLEALLRLPRTRDVEVRILKPPSPEWRGEEDEYEPLLSSFHAKKDEVDSNVTKKLEKLKKRAASAIKSRSKVKCRVMRKEGVAGLIVQVRGYEALGIEGFMPLSSLSRKRWRFWDQLLQGTRAEVKDVSADLHKLIGEEIDACIVELRLAEGSDSPLQPDASTVANLDEEGQEKFVVSEREFLTSRFIQAARRGMQGNVRVTKISSKPEKPGEAESDARWPCVFVDVGHFVREFRYCGVEALLFAGSKDELDILQVGDVVHVELTRLDKNKNQIRAKLVEESSDGEADQLKV